MGLYATPERLYMR